MLILALWAAKYSTWSACDKSFGTMPAKLNRVFAVCQHKTEHHLYAQQQGKNSARYFSVDIVSSLMKWFFGRYNRLIFHKVWCGRQLTPSWWAWDTEFRPLPPSIMYCNPNNFNLYYQLYYAFSSESIYVIFSSKKSFSNKVICIRSFFMSVLGRWLVS